MPAKSKTSEAPDLDVAELARTLERTTANLKRYITDEATRRAAELGKTYAKAADERIRDKDAELQHAQSLVTELRRRLKVMERESGRYAQVVAVVRDASWNGRPTVDTEVLLDIVNSSAREPS